MKDRFEPLPVINPDAAMFAIFGSVEGYLNSPSLKEVKLRIAYLKKLKEELNTRVAMEIKNIRWWNIVNRIRALAVRRIFLPSINKELDGFIAKFENMRGLPVAFFVKQTGEDCDQFLAKFEKLIKKTDVGKYTNVF